MTTFALIRHASHDRLGYTLVGRASGVRLSPKGAREADELADRLKAGSIHALYSSPWSVPARPLQPLPPGCSSRSRSRTS